MQVTKKTETGFPLVFDLILADIPGGVTVAASELTQAYLFAGTPLGRDANGLFHVIKTAVAYANATNSATTYQVKKGHNFKQGDFFGYNPGGVAEAITNINTSNANYDVITVGTTLGVAVTTGDAFVQTKQQAASPNGVLNYEPVGFVGAHFDVIQGDSLLVPCVRVGTMRREALIALGISPNAALMAKIPTVLINDK